MCRDHLQSRKLIHDPTQSCRMRIVITGIAHMKHHKQAFLPHQIVSRIQSGIINMKQLGVRMHFNTPQSRIVDKLHFRFHLFHSGMNRAKAGKFLMGSNLFNNKFIDMPDMIWLQTHWKNHIMGNPRLCALLQQSGYGAIHPATIQLIKLLNASGRFLGNGIRINVTVEINDLHPVIPSFLQRNSGIIAQISLKINPYCPHRNNICASVTENLYPKQRFFSSLLLKSNGFTGLAFPYV